MKYIYYVHCDEECGYSQSIPFKDGEEKLQCLNCGNIESKEVKNKLKLICMFCKNEKVYEGDITFENGAECENCNNKGEIGIEGINDEGASFLVEIEKEVDFSCERCKSKEYQTRQEEGWKCPDCDLYMTEKVSTQWKE